MAHRADAGRFVGAMWTDVGRKTVMPSSCLRKQGRGWGAARGVEVVGPLSSCPAGSWDDAGDEIGERTTCGLSRVSCQTVAQHFGDFFSLCQGRRRENP
jgi:hypothetical protein